MELGETHIPEDSAIYAKDKLYDSIKLQKNILGRFGDEDGIKVWGAFQAFLHLIIGWPAYLLIGATGGPDRGMMNHYFSYPLSEPKQPKKELFPGNWSSRNDGNIWRSIDRCECLAGSVHMVSSYRRLMHCIDF